MASGIMMKLTMHVTPNEEKTVANILLSKLSDIVVPSSSVIAIFSSSCFSSNTKRKKRFIVKPRHYSKKNFMEDN